jgi:Flp pilus assembly protein TadD
MNIITHREKDTKSPLKALRIIGLISALTLSGCASMQENTMSQHDKKVQMHALYDGDINSMEMRAEQTRKAKSGTKFDEINLDEMTPEEQRKFRKMEHIQAGDTAAQTGNSDLALYEYVRALIEDDQDTMTYYKIGILHEVRGSNHLSEMAYKKSLEIDPEFIISLERLGRLKLNERDYVAAKIHFQQAISADQKRFTLVEDGPNVDTKSPYYAYNGMGVIEDLLGNGDAAVSYYEQAAMIRPKSATLANNIGYSYYLRNELEQAEHYFSKAIQLNSNYGRAVRNLALIMVRNERYSDAVNLLNGHIKNEAESFNTVGYICMLDGKHDKADEMFNKAIDISPIHYDLAYKNRELNRELYSKSVYENLN